MPKATIKQYFDDLRTTTFTRFPFPSFGTVLRANVVSGFSRETDEGIWSPFVTQSDASKIDKEEIFWRYVNIFRWPYFLLRGARATVFYFLDKLEVFLGNVLGRQFKRWKPIELFGKERQIPLVVEVAVKLTGLPLLAGKKWEPINLSETTQGRLKKILPKRWEDKVPKSIQIPRWLEIGLRCVGFGLLADFWRADVAGRLGVRKSNPFFAFCKACVNAVSIIPETLAYGLSKVMDKIGDSVDGKKPVDPKSRDASTRTILLVDQAERQNKSHKAARLGLRADRKRQEASNSKPSEDRILGMGEDYNAYERKEYSSHFHREKDLYDYDENDDKQESKDKDEKPNIGQQRQHGGQHKESKQSVVRQKSKEGVLPEEEPLLNKTVQEDKPGKKAVQAQPTVARQKTPAPAVNPTASKEKKNTEIILFDLHEGKAHAEITPKKAKKTREDYEYAMYFHDEMDNPPKKRNYYDPDAGSIFNRSTPNKMTPKKSKHESEGDNEGDGDSRHIDHRSRGA